MIGLFISELLQLFVDVSQKSKSSIKISSSSSSSSSSIFVHPNACLICSGSFLHCNPKILTFFNSSQSSFRKSYTNLLPGLLLFSSMSCCLKVLHHKSSASKTSVRLPVPQHESHIKNLCSKSGKLSFTCSFIISATHLGVYISPKSLLLILSM